MSTAVEQKAHYCKRLFIQVYADDEPQDKAKKMYQICGDIAELSEVVEFLKEYCDIPSADRQGVVRCKDCKYFEYNHTEVVDGVPLILAHEICAFWGGGSKTSENGYCSFGERKEQSDE